MIIIFVCLTACSTVLAAGHVRLDGDVLVPLPEGWLLGSESLTFPFQLVFGEDGAEILLFRTNITGGEIVDDPAALRKSVDGVINEVILMLPDGKLLTSTGFNDGYRTGFVVEFTSTDSLSDAPLTHRLKGIIYRHPEGHQILFTVWGKSASAKYPLVEDAIKQVQRDLQYDGAYEADVYGPRQGQPLGWWLLLAGMVAIGFLIIARRRTSKRFEGDTHHDIHFWQCECGRLNHESKKTCRRCGRLQV